VNNQAFRQATLRITQESYSDHKKNMRAMNLNLATSGGGKGAALWGAAASFENSWRDGGNARGIGNALARVVIRRSLVTMQDQERATLRMADVLVALKAMTTDEFIRIAVPIVFNGGDCSIDFEDASSEFRVRAAMLETLRPLLASSFGTNSGARERLNQAVRSALAEDSSLAPGQRETIERYLFSGNRWMSKAEAARLGGDVSSPSALRIGGFQDSDVELAYDRRESLVTIAPPGSGKTQAHVLRNLLYLRTPALVLDVKGEMLKQTRWWREANVGKTYVFDPASPEDSIRYNPIDEISKDPDAAWDDARRLADFLVIPSGSHKQDSDYFDRRARDIVTAALLDVALYEAPEHRNMSGVLDRVYVSGEAKVREWCEHLVGTGNPQLALEASALAEMPERQRESVLDTARSSLEIWKSPAIRKISSEGNFDPGILRAENATLYLAVKLEDIKKFASVLRVLIGQALAKIYRGTPETDAATVTFFLDELYRLGRMDVIEESLDVGRGYGVRLWMFCQNFGQLMQAYPNAQGMVSNCAVRCYMDPDEETARRISENLGMRAGLLDSHRKPLAEPHELTGPQSADQMVVFMRGAPPARLVKKPAYADPICAARIAGTEPPQDITETFNIHPSKVEATEDASPDAPVEAAATSWEALGPLPQSEPETRKGFELRWPNVPRIAWIGAGAFAVLVVGLYLFNGSLAGIRAEKVTLTKERDDAWSANRSMTSERDRLRGALTSAEQQRDAARKEADSLRMDLKTERDAHAATRERLASLQRQYDTERMAARSAPPAPPTAQAPPPQASPVQAQPAPAPAPPQQASVWPQTTTPTLPPLQAPPNALASSRITDCDTLAANPNDPRKASPDVGVKFPDLRRNAVAAIEACDRAMAANPAELRFTYQRARALDASGNQAQAKPLFDQLIKAGYPAAFDNGGQYFARQGRWQEAETFFRRGAELGDPDAMISLADAIRAGKLPARTAGEDFALYERAASLGHKGAQQEVEEMRAKGAFVDQAAGVLLRSLGR
jgi:type IV secretory pathway TraG/TraD family ATPase VirD4